MRCGIGARCGDRRTSPADEVAEVHGASWSATHRPRVHNAEPPNSAAAPNGVGCSHESAISASRIFSWFPSSGLTASRRRSTPWGSDHIERRESTCRATSTRRSSAVRSSSSARPCSAEITHPSLNAQRCLRATHPRSASVARSSGRNDANQAHPARAARQSVDAPRFRRAHQDLATAAPLALGTALMCRKPTRAMSANAQELASRSRSRSGTSCGRTFQLLPGTACASNRRSSEVGWPHQTRSVEHGDRRR